MTTLLSYIANNMYFDESRFRFPDASLAERLAPPQFSPIVCRFCGTAMERMGCPVTTSAAHYNIVCACMSCGWWTAEACDTCELGDGTGLVRDGLVVGVLKTFRTDNASLPIDILQKELHQRPEIAFETNPTVWEKLVASVLSEFFSCEVYHVGRSGDGGIDLILVNADKPIAIEVKRRTRSNKRESVELVRQVLGAVLLRGYRNAAIVTTGDRFTRPSIEEAATAEALGLVDRFELWDFPQFCRFLKTTGPESSQPWTPYLDHRWLHWNIGY